MHYVYEYDDGLAESNIFRSMYRLRYRLFIELAGWDVPCDHCLKEERDQFDGPGTKYIIRTDEKDNVIACVRMLRTDSPNLLKDVFSNLCDLTPNSPRDWEASRLAVDHSYIGGKETNLCGELYCAIQEFAIAHDAKHIVSVSDRAMEIHLKRGGWKPVRLGTGVDRSDSKHKIFGLSFLVGTEALSRLRKKAGVSQTVFELPIIEQEKIVA